VVTETGVVFKAGHGTAWVRSTRTNACEHCAEKQTCKTLGGGKDVEVEALNPIGAREGDQVVLSFHSTSLFKLSFLIYIFPVLAMIGGALIGQNAAPNYDMDESAAAAIGCFLALAAAFLFIRLIGNRMSGKETYRPKIIRISRMPLPEACASEEAE
jgi:sigma-E factor negative regulatory protein RseC